MRRDLENAIGLALTSRSACTLLLDDPDEFATRFELTDDEFALLDDMADDLADLMPGFVVKRERGLRRTLALTLRLLGDSGGDLVGRFSDAFPPVETMPADLLQFADFLIGEAAARADATDIGPRIVEVARFERLRLGAFNTPGPLWPPADPAPLDPLRIDAARPLALHRSAAMGRFAFDVRSVRSLDGLARLGPDPCVLLCFQWGESTGGRVLRLDDDSVRAVTVLAERPGELSASQLCAAIGTTASPQDLVGKLVGKGALVGALP